MNRRLAVSRMIQAIGVALLVVAGIHLVVTPLLKESILDRVLAPAMMPIVSPPFLLNHVVVGLLLLPLGFITVYSAGGIRAGARWAWVISWAIALSLLALPVSLVVIMRGGPFDATPFRIAEALVTFCALAMPAALLWARAEFRETPGRATGEPFPPAGA